MAIAKRLAVRQIEKLTASTAYSMLLCQKNSRLAEYLLRHPNELFRNTTFGSLIAMHAMNDLMRRGIAGNKKALKIVFGMAEPKSHWQYTAIDALVANAKNGWTGATPIFNRIIQDPKNEYKGAVTQTVLALARKGDEQTLDGLKHLFEKTLTPFWTKESRLEVRKAIVSLARQGSTKAQEYLWGRGIAWQ